MTNSIENWITLAPHFKIFASQCPTAAIEKVKMSCVSSGKIVSNLMYLMVCTRSYIALTMNKMTKCMSNPRNVH